MKKIKDKYIKKRPKKRGPYKKKKKGPNDPRTQKELDAVFQGYRHLNQLSKGIMEEDKDDDQVEDEEDEEECLVDAIPLNWGKMMSNDEKVQEGFIRKLNEGKKKKKKKDNCHPGNPNHDLLGRWTEPGKKGSWSVSNPDGKEDCDYGQLRATGRGKEKQWTKTRCGRKDRLDSTEKAKWKCKDGTLVEDIQAVARDLQIDPSSLEAVKGKLDGILNMYPRFFDDLGELADLIDQSKLTPDQMNERKKKRPMTHLGREEILKICNRYGFSSWLQFLQKLSAIKKAESGKFGEPIK